MNIVKGEGGESQCARPSIQRPDRNTLIIVDEEGARLTITKSIQGFVVTTWEGEEGRHQVLFPPVAVKTPDSVAALYNFIAEGVRGE
jgi:hypothetical protein